MRLIAKRAFRYRGQQLKAGDEFEAGPTDANSWKAIGYASDAPGAAPPAKPKPKTGPPEPAPKAEPERPGYRTRRLRTDD